MKNSTPVSRRRFVQAASLSAFAQLLPSWASSRAYTPPAASHANQFDLTIESTPIKVNGRRIAATGINGTVPGPMLRFREGERVTLNVANTLKESSSIHWHGLILPTDMDGVPGLSFEGIDPGQSYRYEFDVVQNGTYWYHSHSEFQEQTGVYGPIIIDPKEADPIDYDVDFIVMLSDWTFEDPNKIYARLKKMDDYYNRQRRTIVDFFDDTEVHGWKDAVAERRMWGRMRMSATDVADVTGTTYTYLMNGHDPGQNWTCLFKAGQKVRLRIINGSAMTFFNFRIPNLEMTVVQTDGQNVQPVTVDEFQIGVAETYDVIVQPGSDTAYTMFAESMDRSGYARGTLTPDVQKTAEIPTLRKRPLLSMADMGMQHGNIDHSQMAHHQMAAAQSVSHNHQRGPGVANVTENPASRLAEPGTGLTDLAHRVLTYADLKNATENPDTREPTRSIELHLTGNMSRYMWSFDGVKYSEVDGPIHFEYGERLQMLLVNDTMMSHPIHLHGMFVELVNGNGSRNPRKHTIVVKPAERLAVNVTADAPGRWAFHCHMLYHMNGGMMREVRVSNTSEAMS